MPGAGHATRRVNIFTYLEANTSRMKPFYSFLVILAAMTMNVHAQNNTSGKLLRHVVLFKFKDGTPAADIKKVEDAFRALPTQDKGNKII